MTLEQLAEQVDGESKYNGLWFECPLHPTARAYARELASGDLVIRCPRCGGEATEKILAELDQGEKIYPQGAVDTVDAEPENPKARIGGMVPTRALQVIGGTNSQSPDEPANDSVHVNGAIPLQDSQAPFSTAERRVLAQVPASNTDAEESVLGAILINNDLLIGLSQTLKAEDFYAERNRRIYNAMLWLMDEGRPIDAITLAHSLRSKDQLEAVGGGAYLATLAGNASDNASDVSIHVQEHARLVTEAAGKRKMSTIFRDLLMQASNGVSLRGLQSEANRRLLPLLNADLESGQETSSLIREAATEAQISNAEYLSRPAIVEQLYYSQHISLGVGGKHEGKTTMTRTEALSIAMGKPLYGRVTNRTPVIYAASNDEYPSTRMELLRMGWKEDVPLTLVRLNPDQSMEPSRVMAALAKMAQQLDAHFIVLDMLFDFILVQDEIKYAMTREATRLVQNLADIISGHVKATHHSPKWMPDATNAGKAALGSQGLAARFSPIVLSKMWAEGELYTVESTMTRDPRGVMIKPTCVTIDERGWASAVQPFMPWMKWRLYAPRILGLFQGEKDKSLSVAAVVDTLEISRVEVQNALYQMCQIQKPGEPPLLRRHRSAKGRSHAYYYRLYSDELLDSSGEADSFAVCNNPRIQRSDENGISETELKTGLTGDLWTPPAAPEPPEDDLDENGISKSQ